MARTHQEIPTPTPTADPPAPSDASLAGIFSRAVADPEQRVTLLGGFACLALFAMLFRDELWHFYYTWAHDENYSHGFLVPLLSLYFANQIAARGPVPVRSGLFIGSLLLGLAVGLRLTTIPLPIPFLGDVAILFALAGIFTLLLGSRALKRYWFPFFFLIFMVPLPYAMYTRIASPLQLLASRMASMVMNISGLPVLCEGNRMTLPGGVQMFVAEACSGMRQMTGFLALTAAVAYLASRPGWYRAIIVLAALPIALTANVARIVLTGYIMFYVNPEYASGAYHTLEGILMMGFGLLLLHTLCLVLNQLSPPSDTKPGGPNAGVSTDDAAPIGLARPPRPMLSGPAGWSSGGLTENLVSLRSPEE